MCRYTSTDDRARQMRIASVVYLGHIQRWAVIRHRPGVNPDRGGEPVASYGTRRATQHHANVLNGEDER